VALLLSRVGVTVIPTVVVPERGDTVLLTGLLLTEETFEEDFRVMGGEAELFSGGLSGVLAVVVVGLA
jgi:hypothetical protein